MRKKRTICVDLDGTLTKTDTLLENILVFLKEHPLKWYLLFYWLSKGRSFFKAHLAQSCSLGSLPLPYDQKVLRFVEEMRAEGNHLVLCTAANERIAQHVNTQLNLFDEVLASTDKINLKGSRKAQALVDRYGYKSFDYVGNSYADLKVWQASDRAFIANAPPGLVESAQKNANVESVLSTRTSYLRLLMRALRVHQWSKNVLVFVPMLLAHRLSWSVFTQALLAFVAMCFTASSVYVLNDLLDLSSDRLNKEKKKRPFASGELSILHGLVFIPILLFMSVLCTFRFPMLGAVVGTYLIITTLYSFVLKRIAVVDVLVLALLYVGRIIAGSVVTGTPVSEWLASFAVFFFLSLALVKRASELLSSEAKDKIPGRGYHPADLTFVGLYGVSSAVVSILILAFYIYSPRVQILYSHPEYLWLICLLLHYWLGRIWLLTFRGQMHSDPIYFAVKDKQSYLIGALAALIGVFAI
jgi:4-hydroxybenzoate polyprenyltransferase/phosphoserine phosphatase